MSVFLVDERDGRFEQILQMDEVVHLLRAQVVEEPALQRTMVGLDLALGFGVTGPHVVAVHAAVGDAVAKGLAVEGRAAIELHAIGQAVASCGLGEGRDRRHGVLALGDVSGEHGTRVVVEHGQDVRADRMARDEADREWPLAVELPGLVRVPGFVAVAQAAVLAGAQSLGAFPSLGRTNAMNRAPDATRDLSLTGPDGELVELTPESIAPVLLGRSTPEVARAVEGFIRGVASMFETWLQRSANKNTQRTYRRGVLSFVEFLGIAWPEFDQHGCMLPDSKDESWKLLSASVADVRAWRDELLADGQAPATLNARLSALSGFYRFMREAVATELKLPIQVPSRSRTRRTRSSSRGSPRTRSTRPCRSGSPTLASSCRCRKAKARSRRVIAPS